MRKQEPRGRDHTPTGQLEVWDLFAGAGGFSTGAELAGGTVAYACDTWPEAGHVLLDTFYCRFRLRLTIRRIGRLVVYYPHAIAK